MTPPGAAETRRNLERAQKRPALHKDPQLHPLPYKERGQTGEFAISANTQIEAGGRELSVTRIFDAPRRLVFEAWSKAEHLQHWFGPDGFTVPQCEVDFRVGGKYRLCMRGFGGAHWVHGVYREIVAPERIVWTGFLENESTEILTTITFEDYQGKTRLTVHQAFSKETDSTRGARVGWTQTLEHLAAYVATL